MFKNGPKIYEIKKKNKKNKTPQGQYDQNSLINI